MNYTEFCGYVRRVERELIQTFGVPPSDAADIAQYMEAASVCAEAKVRSDVQFEMNFRKHGPAVMTQRTGKSRQALRKRFNRINHDKMETAVSP
jgi:hypothetical protein